MVNEYVFDSDTDLGRDQLELLSAVLDEKSIAILDTIGVRPGQRCLDLGSGAGTIAAQLAERAGPDGQVVAVDLATDQLAEHPWVEVYEHDITAGLPVRGPFDLIHARLLLMHLAGREDLLTTLAGALAPGGRLLITEFAAPPQRVLTVPRPEDEAFFLRMQQVAHAFCVWTAGVSFQWAYEAGPAMVAAGLVDVRCETFSRSYAGGEAGWMLMRNYYHQLRAPFLANDVFTEAELDRFDELLLDPRFSAWIYPCVTTLGRRPTG